ncbi:hypothetical protein J437_LFUL007273 [Ladona fulva]|uniref:Uncharacterized protein n=1 Tax=Ladona fulva TaxID=123851 RepID=A0A8K0NYC9_LADFU|nr:hypothetical protein J437_LFUL007273 [Ladona fulva]
MIINNRPLLQLGIFNVKCLLLMSKEHTQKVSHESVSCRGGTPLVSIILKATIKVALSTESTEAEMVQMDAATAENKLNGPDGCCNSRKTSTSSKKLEAQQVLLLQYQELEGWGRDKF